MRHAVVHLLSSRPMLLSILCCTMLATVGAVAADPLTLSSIEWESAADGGAGRVLVLRFSGPPPSARVAAESWGVSIWVPGIAIGDSAVEGVRTVRESGGSRLRLERPQTTLRAVILDDDALRVVVEEQAAAAAGAGGAYRIGVGDTVTVAVYKNSDVSGEFPVGPDGTINVPLVGAMKAAGLTEAELTERLRALLDAQYLVNPQVSVSVKTYASQFVYVTGSVARSQRVTLRPGMTLKDVLSEAGVALAPGQDILLSRAAGGGETVAIGSAELESGGSPNPRDGDVLTVQERSFVSIQGEVRRPGRFPITAGMTLLDAISMAEGLTEWASKKNVKILHREGGPTTEQVIDLRDVEERRANDPLLRPGDVVLVGKRIL